MFAVSHVTADRILDQLPNLLQSDVPCRKVHHIHITAQHTESYAESLHTKRFHVSHVTFHIASIHNVGIPRHDIRGRTHSPIPLPTDAGIGKSLCEDFTAERSAVKSHITALACDIHGTGGRSCATDSPHSGRIVVETPERHSSTTFSEGTMFVRFSTGLT